MLFEMFGQRLFGATTALWTVFSFATFLDPASAAPRSLVQNGLSLRADNAVGLGVELEVGTITIEGNTAKKDMTTAQKEKIKGATISAIGFSGCLKTNWELTAELGSGSDSQIIPEAIVDGLKNKVGDHNTGNIGDAIVKYFDGWAPCRKHDCVATIEGAEDLGPFKVLWPKDAPRDIPKTRFTPQVTTALPLAAILDILRDTKASTLENPTKNPLASVDGSNRKNYKVLRKEVFKQFSKIKNKHVTEEFLGFFSILTSYCVLAKFSEARTGPKQLTNIMPRTDFVTQYNAFIKDSLEDQLKKISLYEIIEKVSGEKETLANTEFKWEKGVVTPISEDWDGKAEDIARGSLTVKKFLDYIEGYDREKTGDQSLVQMDLIRLMDKTMRHGQIGGLGNKMEPMLKTSKLVPIWELRELEPIPGNEVQATLEAYENKVEDYHKKHAKDKRSADVEGEEDGGTYHDTDTDNDDLLGEQV